MQKWTKKYNFHPQKILLNEKLECPLAYDTQKRIYNGTSKQINSALPKQLNHDD